MATRKVKNAKDLSTGELIYFKGHAQATYMSDGTTVEDAIKRGMTPGGASAEEIYIGSTEPTDSKYKVWINPDEDPEDSDNPGGSGETSNSGIAYVNIPMEGELTEEQIAENAEAFKKITSGEVIMMLTYVDEIGKNIVLPDLFAYDETTIAFVDTQHHSYYNGTTISKVRHIDIVGFLDNTGVVDFYITEEEESPTPASNGPLTFYVGYITTLSAEERLTAEQKEHNAAMFEIYKSSPYALGVFVDQSEVFSASMGMSGRAIKTSVPYQAQYFPPETGAEAIMLKQKITDNNEIGVIIFPDGSVYSAHELE